MNTALEAEAILEPRAVGDITGEFWIPAYQRGYRWGREEVGLLLNDLWDSNGEPYYLQPIVVKQRDDDRFELVDGQQRLTTLFLLLQYMENAGLQSTGPAYSLEYETRPGSREYLKQPHDDTRSQKNIDFFHIHEAYRCIQEWFEAHEHRKQHVANKIYGFLFESVRVIWYEAPRQLDATTLFTRLNVGRIPLTNAELVKAHLLTRSGERQHEIAAQWDSVERDLRDPDVWAFVSGRADSIPTHIDLLLDTIAGGPTGRERSTFYTFEKFHALMEESSPVEVWNKVVDLHAHVLGWYDDRDLYHKIGYLIFTGTPLTDLVKRAEKVTKRRFSAELDDRIRVSLALSPDELVDLGYNSDGRKCERALLLLNVETVRRRQRSTERFLFREHAAGTWSLEHIHAQNAEELNRAEQWREWLRLHGQALGHLPDLDHDIREALRAKIEQTLSEITEHSFRELEQELTAVFSAAGDDSESDVHSIANLALLSATDNSALSNSVFEVKRSQILERDRLGAYIPPATRNVFLKYYTDADAQQVHYWGVQDRRAYTTALQEMLSPYLTKREATA